MYRFCKSESKSNHSSNSVQHQLVQRKEALDVISPFKMSLQDFAIRLEDTRSAQIFKSGSQAIIAHQPLDNKGTLLRGASPMWVDFSKLDSVSGQKYGEPSGEPVCV